MTQRRALLVLALLATVAWTGSANGGYFYDVWGPSADGSMDMHPTEGYSIAGDGNYRFAKTYNHMAFMAFNGKSDGPDKIPDLKTGDTDDGVLLADWLVGKKAFGASLYFQDVLMSCDSTQVASLYLNDPVVIMGVRCANVGPLVDRGSAGHGFSGCCATYENAFLEGGENAPPAWRMGPPAATAPKYTKVGDMGAGAEPWKVSTLATTWAGLNVVAGGLPGSTFTTAGASYQGYSDNARRFAFGWLVQYTDGHMINSGTIGTADCTGDNGGQEPRDLAKDLIYGQGWYAKHIDRCIINAMVTDPELKGLVFQAIASPIRFTGQDQQPWNNAVVGRDQGGGVYSPYIALHATYDGDIDEDGTVDVMDLLTLSPTFGLSVGDAGYDAMADLNCDNVVDISDLLTMAVQFGAVTPLN